MCLRQTPIAPQPRWPGGSQASQQGGGIPYGARSGDPLDAPPQRIRAGKDPPGSPTPGPRLCKTVAYRRIPLPATLLLSPGSTSRKNGPAGARILHRPRSPESSLALAPAEIQTSLSSVVPQAEAQPHRGSQGFLCRRLLLRWGLVCSPPPLEAFLSGAKQEEGRRPGRSGVAPSETLRACPTEATPERCSQAKPPALWPTSCNGLGADTAPCSRPRILE